MHQHPRTPPVRASSSTSPWSNTGRREDARDQGRADRTRPASESYGGDDRAQDPRLAGDISPAAGPAQQTMVQTREAKQKLNQIIQNYFTKAALIIAQARVICPACYTKGIRRVNKWFNVEIDETDLFREAWRTWKTCDADANRPPPMIIETFLDTADLSATQSLVVIDDNGKRRNVAEALSSSDTSVTSRAARSRRSQVILERWYIDLGPAPADQPNDLNAILPVVYKKSIVLFRSLYTYSKFLPAYKFSKRLAKTKLSSFKVHCRILNGDLIDQSATFDALKVPLFDGSGPVTDDYTFGATESPAGPFSVRVIYRNSCEFRVDDSDALLSSHLMGDDDRFFRPSLGGTPLFDDPRSNYLTSAKATEVGSLPTERHGMMGSPDRTQAYGSLSTFHQVGPPTSSSPISALRAARELGSDSRSSSPPTRAPPDTRPTQSPKTALRSPDGTAGTPRRPSVSFQPFKSPALSASPSHASQINPASPRNSLGRTSALNALTQARNRNSLEAASSSAYRSVSNQPESAIASSTSASPKPAPITRYSSSFGHRKGRLSSGGTSKTDDENNSSGKGSLTSSAQPGSGMLAEGGTGGSSGSVKTDDDNISEFLKMLDQKKNLKSFEAGGDSVAATSSSKRTSAALSKFQKMRDSNAALSDSISSSSMLHHRSSSSSSRQLSSVPPMVTGTSMSTSSSPGKPISPHTPHTPAIPSRLSANSIVEYSQPRRSHSDARSRPTRPERRADAEEVGDDTATRDLSTNAIDIPTSPRPFHPGRRSSSVAQHRAIPIEDETGDLLPYGIRSASLGAEDRPPLSLSALLGAQEASETALVAPDGEQRALQPAVNPEEPSVPMSRGPSSSMESREGSSHQNRGGAAGSANSPYRPRIGRTGGRGLTPPQGSFSSFGGDRGSGSGTSDRPAGGRYSMSRAGQTFEEDEPLLFAMSEIGIGGQQGRRSIEEMRGGFTSGPSDRGGDSGASSRRGSRRGGGPPW